jgi:hypothetical protein
VGQSRSDSGLARHDTEARFQGTLLFLASDLGNLTDLEGDAGDEPAFPVLWAVAEGKAEAPWGKIIELS